MHRNLLFPLTILVAVITLNSCKTADKGGLPIPKDAGFVFHINTPSLASKLTWQEINETGWFKELYTDAPDSVAKQILADPASSGISADADMVFFSTRRGKGGYAVLEGTLKDAAAFEAFNKKVQKQTTVKKNGDINIIESNAGPGIATWSGTRFIYVLDMPTMAWVDRNSGYNQPERYSIDSLTAIAKELYSLEGSKSLTSEKKYADLLKETGDFHMWVNAETMFGGMASDMLSMMKASILFEGSISAATFNFDNGKIVMNTKTYYNDVIGKVYEKYRMKNFDVQAFNRVPAKNVIAAFAMNYPPDGLKEFMKVIGVDGFVNSYMGEIGYSVDEFVKANKGDILVTVSDFEIKTEQVTIPAYDENGQPSVITRSSPSMKVLFATSVNDKPAFDKLVAALKEKMGGMFEDGRTPKISYSLNDKWFAAGNAEEQVNGFLAGSSSNNHSFISKISGHPAGFYLDLHKIIEASGQAETDSTSRSKKMLDASLKMWEDVIMTGGEIKDGAYSATVVVNLVDKNTNSLKQLNQYIDRMHEDKKSGF